MYNIIFGTLGNVMNVEFKKLKLKLVPKIKSLRSYGQCTMKMEYAKAGEATPALAYSITVENE